MNKIKLVCSLLKEKKHVEARGIINCNFKNDLRLFNYYMGLYYCSKSNYYEANNYFRIAESYGLKNYIFYYNYANSYLELRDFERAKEFFKKAINLNREHKPSYLNLSYILESEGNLKEAYRVIKSCLSYSNDIELLKYERILLNKIRA